MKFQPMQTGTFLSGSPIIEDVSEEEFELLGAIKDWEPEWRRNDAGGYDHYEYGGERCYVPLLFVREVGSSDVVAFSLNGRFVSVDIPDLIPAEWGTTGKRFRLRDDYEIVWSAKKLIPKPA